MTANATRFVPPLEIPRDFNGYVAVARPALRIQARDVQVGDILILDGYVTRVDYIDREKTPCGCEIFHFKGSYNIFRGWHETVSVIRPPDTVLLDPDRDQEPQS